LLSFGIVTTLIYDLEKFKMIKINDLQFIDTLDNKLTTETQRSDSEQLSVRGGRLAHIGDSGGGGPAPRIGQSNR
jgi:hypothetical protein